MSKIKLTTGILKIPEGTHILKIVSVKYNEDFGKIEITLQTRKGEKHVERFSLLKADGSINDGAMGAFSYFAKTAMGNYDLVEIDPVDLVGHYLECDVEHEDVNVGTSDNPKINTYSRLRDKRPSNGWETASPPSRLGGIDLNTLFDQHES